jgi:type II secretory pathway component PulF
MKSEKPPRLTPIHFLSFSSQLAALQEALADLDEALELCKKADSNTSRVKCGKCWKRMNKNNENR